jgi:hypothetical protein
VLRVALVRLEYWGPNYARVVDELADCQLVLVADHRDAR